MSEEFSLIREVSQLVFSKRSFLKDFAKSARKTACPNAREGALNLELAPGETVSRPITEFSISSDRHLFRQKAEASKLKICDDAHGE